jgi:hypothetical protein
MPIRISELDPVTTINGGEYIPVVQDGDTKKALVRDTLGYKVYRAQLSYNTTTSQLTVNVLQDTFFDIIVAKGVLSAIQINSSDGQYTANKTLVFVSQNNNKGNTLSGTYDYIFYTAFRQNTGRIFLTSRGVNLEDNEVDAVDLYTELSIEIRVYP